MSLKNKRLVSAYLQKLNTQRPETHADVLREYLAEDVAWHGPHPLNDLVGVEAVYEGFWGPLQEALEHPQLNPYILMSGRFDGKDWVATTGDVVGRMGSSYLGIPASGRTVSVRYGEFMALENGKISASYLLLDLPALMQQAGLSPFPYLLADDAPVPGPRAGDGILLSEQDAGASAASVTLVERMIGGLGAYDQRDKGSMEQAQFWSPEMLWYGPHGIGTTYGLTGFEEHHQLPFLKAFPDRKGGNHKARFGDGLYAASTGWPSIRATHQGDYLGVSPTGKRVEMRVMDFWRRDGDRLHENWVFIDMPHLFLQMGVDVLGRARG